MRETIFENLAGDLEYHPRRAVLYLALGIAAMCVWIFAASERKFTTLPLVFALGSLTLLVKGIFLLRKSSEGLGLTNQELDDLSDASRRKELPPLTAQFAQVVQDFGTGPMLLWPLLRMGRDIDQTLANPPEFPVFVWGAVLFGLGFLVRWVVQRQSEQ